MKTNLFVFLMLIVGSAGAQRINTTAKLSKKTPMLTYIDGSNNVYEIYNDSIHYKPVTDPMQSSSGIYTGGTPAVKALQPGEYETAKNKFNALVNDKKLKITDRVMGCGTLLIDDGKKQKQTLIRNGPEKEALEKYLKSLL
jgi:hypothetical protein